jgi:hypothetical protein
MTRFLSLLTFTLLLICPRLGLTEEVDVTDTERLQQSLTTWQTLKNDAAGNYRYFVRRSSFTGAGSETEIVVRKGKVAGRRYREYGPPAPTPPGEELSPIEYKWSERGDDLGSHKEGAEPKTIDELYAEAAEIISLKLEPHQRRYLTFDKQGVLAACFYVDTRIADDAPTTGPILSEVRLERK